MKGGNKMEDIIGIIQAYKEDHPQVIITDEMIKDIIDVYKDELVKEIRKEIGHERY